MQSHQTGEILQKPSMVEWEVQISSGTGQKKGNVDQRVGVHTCTDKDFEKFYKRSKNMEPRFDHLRQLGAWNCMDDADKDGNPVN